VTYKELIKSTYGNIKEEPRTSCTEENLSILPGSVEGAEVSEASLGDFESLGLLLDLTWGEVAGCSTRFTLQVSIGVALSLLDITSYVEGVSWGLWDGKTVVQSTTCWHSTKAYNDEISDNKL
jgi:hypothetical protein